jgi:NAD(P)-dependent dehydrogenase (short-subunit alcohol dehydrogenase family)
MTDTTALVTGATSGIGRATASALADSGFHVLAVGRDQTRGEQLMASITPEQGRFLRADLSSIAGVERLAGEVRELCDRIDLLVNNAGVSLRTKQITEDGIEATFAINTVAPFLLTRKLLDPLTTAQGRVVNVVTELSGHFRIAIDDLADPPRYSMFRAYSASKLALMMVTIEQARRFADRNVEAVGFHPGVVLQTRLSDEMPKAFNSLGPILATLIGRPPTTAEAAAEALRTTALGAAEPGVLYTKGRSMEPPAQAQDAEVRAALWSLLENLIQR